MEKIPSLFVRDYERIITEFKPHTASLMPDGSTSMAHEIVKSKKGRFLATEQLTPGCEWAINGEGVATRKWDGLAVRINTSDINKPLFSKRFDAKHGKTPPPNFEPCQEFDPITGHWPGWVPVNPNDPADRWIIEAYNNHEFISEGTFEAVGPKINGNKDGFEQHMLMKHGEKTLVGDAPRSFSALKTFLAVETPIEGIVFHHPDGRMCKVKRSDFGLPW